MRKAMLEKLPLLVVLALVTAGTASCARVEADVPEAEVTQKGLSFQGIPNAHQLGEVSTSQSFTLSSDNLSWAKNLNSEVYATKVEVKADSGVQDLGFIHYARVTLTDGAADSTTPGVDLIDYERPDNAPASSVISVKTNYPIDVTKVWEAKQIVVTLQLAGVFPEQAWSADVTLHLGGKISYKF